MNDQIDDLIDIFAPEPQPEPLKLGRHALYNFTKAGGRGLAIIFFDNELGPIVKYYYLKRGKLISTLLKNKAFSVEMSIIGKYAEEIVLKNGVKALIYTFSFKNTDKNFIVVELSEKNDKKLLKSIINEIVSKLKSVKKANSTEISKTIRSVLEKKWRSSSSNL